MNETVQENKTKQTKRSSKQITVIAKKKLITTYDDMCTHTLTYTQKTYIYIYIERERERERGGREEEGRGVEGEEEAIESPK